MGFSNVVIAGVHATKQARRIEGRNSMDMCVEAVDGALADAGLAWHDVDGFALDWPGPTGQVFESGCWARYTKRNASFVTSSIADSCGVRGLMRAAAAIETGLADVVVVGGGVAGVRAASGSGAALSGTGLGLEFVDNFGASTTLRFALAAQRSIHVHKRDPAHLADVAALIRNNGHVNPEAVMFGKGPFTRADILASPVIATPFHMLHICIMAEGGAAIVLARKDRARDLLHPAICIAGAGMEHVDGMQPEMTLWEDVGAIGADAIARAYAMAGVNAGDVDVFNVYDPNAFEVIRQIELLGLCGIGEGGSYAASGAIARDGATPVNPDGGLLSHSWISTQQTTLKIIESVRQLRGTATNQIHGVDLAVSTNGGTATGQYGCVVLHRSH